MSKPDPVVIPVAVFDFQMTPKIAKKIRKYFKKQKTEEWLVRQIKKNRID